MFKKFVLVPIVLLLALIPATVLAAPFIQGETFPDTLQIVGTIVAALVGWPAFLAAIINLLKVPIPFLKWYGIPDGTAGKLAFWANALAYVVVFVSVVIGRIDWINMFDLKLSSFANVLVIVLSFLTSLGMTNLSNKVWRGVGAPGLGHRHASG